MQVMMQPSANYTAKYIKLVHIQNSPTFVSAHICESSQESLRKILYLREKLGKEGELRKRLWKNLRKIFSKALTLS